MGGDSESGGGRRDCTSGEWSGQGQGWWTQTLGPSHGPVLAGGVPMGTSLLLPASHFLCCSSYVPHEVISVFSAMSWWVIYCEPGGGVVLGITAVNGMGWTLPAWRLPASEWRWTIKKVACETVWRRALRTTEQAVGRAGWGRLV